MTPTDETIRLGQAGVRVVEYAAMHAYSNGFNTVANPIANYGILPAVREYAARQGDLSMAGAHELTLAGNKVKHAYNALAWFAIARDDRKAEEAERLVRAAARECFAGASYARAAGYILQATKPMPNILLAADPAYAAWADECGYSNLGYDCSVCERPPTHVLCGPYFVPGGRIMPGVGLYCDDCTPSRVADGFDTLYPESANDAMSRLTYPVAPYYGMHSEILGKAIPCWDGQPPLRLDI